MQNMAVFQPQLLGTRRYIVPFLLFKMFKLLDGAAPGKEGAERLH